MFGMNSPFSVFACVKSCTLNHFDRYVRRLVRCKQLDRMSHSRHRWRCNDSLIRDVSDSTGQIAHHKLRCHPSMSARKLGRHGKDAKCFLRRYEQRFVKKWSASVLVNIYCNHEHWWQLREQWAMARIYQYRLMIVNQQLNLGFLTRLFRGPLLLKSGKQRNFQRYTHLLGNRTYRHRYDPS